MISGSDYGEWFIFHEDLADELQAHFDAGGTVEMLNGTKDTKNLGSRNMALYHCVNEHALECLPIMMKKGAKPDDDIWHLVFRLSRTEWARKFLEYGFWPTMENITSEKPYLYKITDSEPIKSSTPIFYCRDEVTFLLCKNAVIQILCIAKNSHQPMSHLWKIVARFLHATKYEEIWLKLLI